MRKVRWGSGLISKNKRLTLLFKGEEGVTIIMLSRINIGMIKRNESNKREPRMIVEKIAIIFVSFINEIAIMRLVGA